MFTFQRSVFRAVRPHAFRTNATLSANSPSTSSSTVAAGIVADEATKGRKKKIPTRRPNISLQNPKAWNEPLAPGVVPAYDLALEILKKDSQALKLELESLKKHIESEESKYQDLVKAHGKGENGEAHALDLELEKLREKLHILEVQSEVNLPDVRWRVANAMPDMANPSNRHLVEQRWRKDGDLDLLMERLYQMKVIPDLLPEIRPSVDLHLTARGWSRTWSLLDSFRVVEPGTYVLPAQTTVAPKLYANVFHTDTRLYTLVMIDPDVPNEETASYTNYLHWMQPNIPLSALNTGAAEIQIANDHTQYVPPHPQRGTPYHRYTVFLIPQPPLEGEVYSRNTEARAIPGVPTSQKLDIPAVKDEERFGFDLRAFCRQYGLDARQGGGAHMFRQVWDEEVSKIYADILKIEEPRYGRIPKPDPYADIKYKKKYSS